MPNIKRFFPCSCFKKPGTSTDSLQNLVLNKKHSKTDSFEILPKVASLDEGQCEFFGKNSIIIYPSISSCLTITCLTSDGRKMGGHAVLIPEKSEKQLSLTQILDGFSEYIIRNNLKDQVQKMFLIGDLVTWNENFEVLTEGRYKKVNQLQKTLFAKKLKKIDVNRFTNEGKEAIQVEIGNKERVIIRKRNQIIATF